MELCDGRSQRIDDLELREDVGLVADLFGIPIVGHTEPPMLYPARHDAARNACAIYECSPSVFELSAKGSPEHQHTALLGAILDCYGFALIPSPPSPNHSGRSSRWMRSHRSDPRPVMEAQILRCARDGNFTRPQWTQTVSNCQGIRHGQSVPRRRSGTKAKYNVHLRSTMPSTFVVARAKTM
jgi:hypothetical protein